MTNAYARAGVDVEAGYEVVKRISAHIDRTKRVGVMGAIGGFGGCFDLSQYDLEEPVLVSGTDGVGTKLMVAQMAGEHGTIGIDCVAMCVNDVVAQGAEPLFFLDYIAAGKNRPEVLEQVVAGIAEGCVQAGCALIGGETAEMPGLYQPEEYDLAGFTVGLAQKSQLITGDNVSAGDLLVGLPSSGVHSNGFSLVRKIFFEQHGFSGNETLPELEGETLFEALLEPTRIYVKPVMPLVRAGLLRGIAHVTGGGFVENLPRMLPPGLAARVNLGSWPIPRIFSALQKYGQVPPEEMYEIFNMGIGMVLAVAPGNIGAVQEELDSAGEQYHLIGEVVASPDPALIFGESGESVSQSPDGATR